ncbi:DUF58 domain-containing protein [Fodinicola feengrottensis]|uniref:DUF58 domain-containing protein n=1 Tax=Fodinicola feengrottensis TaxID=435914 RepID=UPI002441F8FD|nr:DUF58 domain-containing protein [Fodinicola feengrottensis]
MGRSRLTTGDTATLWVHPRTLPMRAISSGRLRNHYAGPPTAYALGGSMDLREVREYVPGDEVRHLHWKATAKTGQLMVRDYVDPNQPRFTTLLDTRQDFMPASVFEDAVDLAASLLVSAVQADYRCRFLSTCGLDVATASGVRSGARQVLDELCQLGRAEQTGPLVPPQLGGGGGLVVVLSELSPADRTALAAIRGRFATVVLIMVGGRTEVAIPGVRVLSAATAEDAVHRWNTVISR